MQLSVIIPAYNREHLIGETLQSLLNQTLSADEIIVVDDGSTDGTANAAREAFAEWESEKEKGKKSPVFKLLAQENRGPAVARNAGLAASKGEFIHFFDSDDIAVPNKHEVQFHGLQESGADIAYGPWVKGRFNGKFFRAENHVFQQRGLPQGDLIKALLTNWSIVPHACLFRRSIVEKSGGFTEHLFGAEDQMMFLKCLLAGAKVVHSPGALELYRIGHADKITATGNEQKRLLANWARFLLDAEEECQRHGIKPSGWFGFRRRAWEADEDMKTFKIDEPVLRKRLSDLHRDGAHESFYKWHRQLERWGGGLQRRLTGARALKSFQVGKITGEQLFQIHKMGIEYVNPVHFKTP